MVQSNTVGGCNLSLSEGVVSCIMRRGRIDGFLTGTHHATSHKLLVHVQSSGRFHAKLASLATDIV